jgi:hypothetical protein
LLEGSAKKCGLKLSQSQLRHAAERNIHYTKRLENPPSTIFVGDEYKDDRYPYSNYKAFNPEASIVKKNFDLDFTKVPVLGYDPKSSKVHIQPVPEHEKSGFRWGKEGRV